MEIGVDIIEINRIKNACRRKSFKNRFFTSRELYGLEGKRNYHMHIAGKFAAKEAVVKAMGIGFRNMKWKDIEILNEASGKPQVILSGKAQETLELKGFSRVIVSISHCREYAVAFAVALGGVKDENCESLHYERDGQNRH
ncbi:MAG: holo-ACP synthase [Tepidanaerobacteraceae bacterium]|nr:holo-ACP synthase [Tepidanaerobacteraceae bacterium]